MENMNNPFNSMQQKINHEEQIIVKKIKCDICSKSTPIDMMNATPVTEWLMCNVCYSMPMDTNRIKITSYVKHVSLNFERFDFELTGEGPGLVYEDGENEFFHFALVHDHESNKHFIQVASSDDYWLYEDVTDYFNLPEVLEMVTNLSIERFYDATKDFLQFLIDDMEMENDYNQF